MEERIKRLEAQVVELVRKIDLLERRITALSESPDVLPKPPPDELTPPAVAAEPSGAWSVSQGFEDLLDRHRIVHLAGLASLVLAGAIILRNVTISSPVPLAAGASLGLAYCAFLLFVADRKLRAGFTLHGDVFTILAVLLLEVLLVEVTRKEGGFSRETGYAVLLASLAAFSFLVIRRRRVVPFNVGLLATIAAGVAIGGRPFLHPWFAGILIAVIVAARFGMAQNGWRGARWAPELLSLLYLGALGIFGRASATGDFPHLVHARPIVARSIVSGLFALLVLFAVAVALFRPRRLDECEATMAILGALVAPAATVGIVLALPGGDLALGAVIAGLALLFYVVAGISYIKHGAESGSFYPLTAIAVIYSIASLAILVGWSPILGVAYVGLALALAVFASRYGKRSISFQAHLLTFLSFVVLAATAIRLAPPEGAEGTVEIWLPAAGFLTVLVFARLRTFRQTGERFSLSSLSVQSVALILILAAGGIEILVGALPAVHALGRLLVAPADLAGSTALWYTSQTILLVAGASTPLAFGLWRSLGGVTVLGAALMTVGGLKLFLFDAFRVPGGYLVISSAVFGVALIVSSFLYRRHRGLGGTRSPHEPEAS
jgi:hypothetical protein